MKRLFSLLFVCILNATTFAQSVDDAVYCTEVTYEIKNYKGNFYTPLMYLCQDTKTKEYYHLSNFEDNSDSCLVFYLGTLGNTIVLYKKMNEYIISGDSTLNETIKDAKNREFKLQAPKDEKRLGTFIIIQEDGSDKWGIISKQHIRNFSRVFPDDWKIILLRLTIGQVNPLTIDIDASNINRIKQGKYSVGLDVLTKIANALGCKVYLDKL